MISESITLRTSADTRNNQAGDWRFSGSYPGQHLHATSIPLKDPRHCFLIQFHEMIEAVLCRYRGITDEDVTDFDARFEAEREQGLHSPTAEDGDDARAPYRAEHFTATTMERMMAAELGVDWADYEQAIANYFNGRG